jgi:hypothetical protein
MHHRAHPQDILSTNAAGSFGILDRKRKFGPFPHIRYTLHIKKKRRRRNSRWIMSQNVKVNNKVSRIKHRKKAL